MPSPHETIKRDYEKYLDQKTEEIRSEYDYTVGEHSNYLGLESAIPGGNLTIGVGRYDDTLTRIRLDPEEAVAFAKYILSKYPDA